MSKWEKARAALALDAQQTIIPRTTAQIALAEALTELVPDEEARLYVVCNNLLDPEENRHCEWDGYLTFHDELARCPSCRRLVYQSEGEEDS